MINDLHFIVIYVLNDLRKYNGIGDVIHF